MKVLLVYANTYDFLLPPPVGLSLMTEPVRKAGHEVKLVDLMKEKDPDGILGAALKAFNPDVVGFSLRNLDNQNYREPEDFVPDYAHWVGMANEVAPTITGGSAVMTMSEELFKRVGATYGMVGQGDKAFPMFLKELQNGALHATLLLPPGVPEKAPGE
ncbi:MAG: cobalamin-dependent protein [Candidatus Pacebacteria bacterium]|nr:cobalamin-dependent protein [Candidatus Paceibacterota bacterium]